MTVVLLVAFAVEVAPVVDVYLAGRLHDVSHVHVWVNLQQGFSTFGRIYLRNPKTVATPVRIYT